MPKSSETSNKIRQEDLENLVKNENIFEKFKDKTILVTGATGFIGSEVVMSLICANRVKNLNIKVLALIRNEKKAKEIFKNIVPNENLKFILQDIKQKLEFEEKVDYIIHLASNTKSKDMVNFPYSTALDILEGTKNILQFAKEKNAALVFASSIEVYGNLNQEEPIKENSPLGQIDILNPRSSYPMAKRMAENLCFDFSFEYGPDIKIARLTQTLGAGSSYFDERVFSKFTKNAIEKEDIILFTKGDTSRNYCYITDCVLGILTILTNGKTREIYNLANKNAKCTILEGAKIIASKEKNIKVKIEINEEEKNFPPQSKIFLDTEKLENLGFKAKVGLEEMFQRLYLSLLEEKNENKF